MKTKNAIATILAGICMNGSANAVVFQLNQFSVVTPSSTFLDSFDTGVPPPTGPNGPNTYSIWPFMLSWNEASGKLLLEPYLSGFFDPGSNGVLTTTGAYLTSAFVNPVGANGASFSINGIFDLALNGGTSFYGIEATDISTGNAIVLGVSTLDSKAFAEEINVNTGTTIASPTFSNVLSGNNQISFTLSSSGNPGTGIQASFQYYNNLVPVGNATTIATFDATATGYVPTIAAGTAVSSVPEPETYAMLLAGLGLLGLAAKGKKG